MNTDSMKRNLVFSTFSSQPDAIDSMTTMTTPTKAKADPPTLPSLSLSRRGQTAIFPILLPSNRRAPVSPRLVPPRIVYTSQSLQIAKRVQLTNFPRVTTRQPYPPTSLTILRPITSRSSPTPTADFVADTPADDRKGTKRGGEKNTVSSTHDKHNLYIIFGKTYRFVVETVRVVR